MCEIQQLEINRLRKLCRGTVDVAGALYDVIEYVDRGGNDPEYIRATLIQAAKGLPCQLPRQFEKYN